MLELNTFRIEKTTILSHRLIDSGFKGTVVNQASIVLNGGSLEIMSTAPIRIQLIHRTSVPLVKVNSTYVKHKVRPRQPCCTD